MSISIEEVYKIVGLWFFQDTFGWHLSDLPPNDTYEALTKAMLICAKGDGVLAPEERDWIIGFSAVRGMSLPLIEEMKKYEATEDIEAVISRTSQAIKAKRAAIYYAIKACSADAEYHEGEQAYVRKMADLIGVSEEEVSQLEAMCLEEKRLQEKRVKLLFPDGLPYSS
ncbi:TerB family tellurite resistance protein [Moorena producens]|uniref:TerB family tellurite resistance protein n=1 Tax=Moorena producens TaxID=1155739 RepID=UPI003C75719F